jgi:hypothetical protein
MGFEVFSHIMTAISLTKVLATVQRVGSVYTTIFKKIVLVLR